MLVVLISGFFMISTITSIENTRLGDPEDSEQVSLGQGVYAEHCGSCHGYSLEGQPKWQEPLPSGRLRAPPHDNTGHTWHHPDDALFGMTKLGMEPFMPAGYESDMPAYGEVLTDTEIWAVLSFIKRAWPQEILVSQQNRSRR